MVQPGWAGLGVVGRGGRLAMDGAVRKDFDPEGRRSWPKAVPTEHQVMSK